MSQLEEYLRGAEQNAEHGFNAEASVAAQIALAYAVVKLTEVTAQGHAAVGEQLASLARTVHLDAVETRNVLRNTYRYGSAD